MQMSVRYVLFIILIYYLLFTIRPEYRKLSFLREAFPNVPFMAVTATASTRVRFDVSSLLSMENPKW